MIASVGWNLGGQSTTIGVTSRRNVKNMNEEMKFFKILIFETNNM